LYTKLKLGVISRRKWGMDYKKLYSDDRGGRGRGDRRGYEVNDTLFQRDFYPANDGSPTFDMYSNQTSSNARTEDSHRGSLFNSSTSFIREPSPPPRQAWEGAHPPATISPIKPQQHYYGRSAAGSGQASRSPYTSKQQEISPQRLAELECIVRSQAAQLGALRAEAVALRA
ncbi:unnamed protein product, partial [Heterosigma akashiwo]